MITTNGKNIIAKYLLNQAPEFASHIAIGIGGNALSTSSSVSFVQDAESLDFEVFRVPVLSKGLIKEDGVEKIIFKAELPTDQRFLITEVGLFPAETNKLAENYGSKIVSAFTQSEPWLYSQLGSSSVVSYIGPLPLNETSSGDVKDTYGELNIPNPQYFYIDSNSPIFEFSERKDRKEPPRYLNKSLVTYGNSSVLDSSFDITAASASASYYVENNSVNLNLGKNLPTDQIKIALSVISKDLLEENGVPENGARLRLELINNTAGTPKAYINLSLTNAQLEYSRHNVITKSLSDFTVTSSSFSWSNIDSIRIYSCVVDATPEEYFIIFDGIRFENISTPNPLYSLVAAEYLKTPDAYPVLKRENSTSYIEYRFGLGVS